MFMTETHVRPFQLPKSGNLINHTVLTKVLQILKQLLQGCICASGLECAHVWLLSDL